MVPDVSGTTVRELGRLVRDGFNQRDVRMIERAVSGKVRQHSNWLGRTDLRQKLTFLFAVVPDARLSLEDYLILGDTALVSWTISGTHLGEYMRMSPTGRQVTLAGTTVARIEEGKVAEYWEAVDFVRSSLGSQGDRGLLSTE